MLGSALFEAGYEIQDAPRYGAERRGAPIFAFVRADLKPINERGVINQADLVLVADDSLVGVPSAAVLQGVSEKTVLFIISGTGETEWHRRLNTPAKIVTHELPLDGGDPLHDRFMGAECVGAAARLLGKLDFEQVEAGIRRELSSFDPGLVDKNVAVARRAFDALEDKDSLVTEGDLLHVDNHRETHWIELENEDINHAAPAIHEASTSVQVSTGLWRTIRPIIEYDRCKKCNWVCSNFCPDNAITVNDDGYPEIDLNHCKGCLICLAQCPPHAIVSMAETLAVDAERSTASNLG